MKKIFLLTIAFFTLRLCNVKAQDIQVVGVGSASVPAGSIDKSKWYTTIGGPKISDYNKLDDGSYECIYSYTISKNDKNGNPVIENYNTILQLGNKVGRFTDYSIFQRDSITFSQNPDEEKWVTANMKSKNVPYRFYGDILFNHPSGELTYTDIITPFYQEYTEPFPMMEWQIEEQQDTVCGYLCTRATGSYGGRQWEAWFTEEIPSDMGPWKFSGLPGLIMRVKDSEGVHTFNAISFREGKTPVVKPNNPLIQSTTRKKFVDFKQKFEANPLKTINPETISEIIVGTSNNIIINGVEVPRHQNGYTPIELE